MRNLLAILVFISGSISAGDFASGNVEYKANFSEKISAYSMTEQDKIWVNSLIQNLNYEGEIVHFIKTNLALEIEGERVAGKIYRALEYEDRFYVLEGDVMLHLKNELVTSPGTGGFSMHSPKSKNFIACLNCEMGVPLGYWSRSSIGYKAMWWKATDRNRL